MTERALIPNAGVPLPSHLLDPDEKAIWWDRPDPQRYALRGAGFKIPFSVFFVGFSVFWMVGASKSGGPFWMFGLMFFGAGSWMLSEPLRRFWQAKSMDYLLTDRRAVVSTNRSTESFAIGTMRSIEASGHGQPLGDVLFVDRVIAGGEGPNQIVKDGFIGITDAQIVAREMRRLQAAAA
jgi:hypothetical protein